MIVFLHCLCFDCLHERSSSFNFIRSDASNLSLGNWIQAHISKMSPVCVSVNFSDDYCHRALRSDDECEKLLGAQLLGINGKINKVVTLLYHFYVLGELCRLLEIWKSGLVITTLAGLFKRTEETYLPFSSL